MKHTFSIGVWILELFNPPLRESLTLQQKAGRVLLVTMTLVTLSIIAALALALAFYAYQCGRNILVNVPHLANALKILVCSIAVNVVCVSVLLRMKRFDQRLMRPPVKSIEIPLPAALTGTKK